MSRLELVEKYLTPNPYSCAGIAMERPRGLVYHYLGKAGQTAAECWRYFEGLKNQVSDEWGRVPHKASAHFIIDLDGTTLQLMPIPIPSTGKGGEVAFHAGPVGDTVPEARFRFGPWPNATLLGIEMCHTDAAGRFTEAALESARELGMRLCEMYDLDPEDEIVRHYDITRKLCPRWFVEHPQEWADFRQSIGRRMLVLAAEGSEDGDC